MSPPGCQKMSAKPCNRNAEKRFPVLSLKSREQKPPNPLLIQDKNVLQPRLGVTSCAMPPRTALDASAPAAPVRRGDEGLAVRACLARACLAWAICGLLAREAASGGTQDCARHGTRPHSPHTWARGSARWPKDACRGH